MGFSLQNGIQPVSDYMQSSFILSFFVSYDYSEKINDKNYPNVHCMRQSLIYSSDFLGLINQDWVIKWLSKKNLLLKQENRYVRQVSLHNAFNQCLFLCTALPIFWKTLFT